jgi:hypothetical protein
MSCAGIVAGRPPPSSLAREAALDTRAARRAEAHRQRVERIDERDAAHEARLALAMRDAERVADLVRQRPQHAAREQRWIGGPSVVALAQPRRRIDRHPVGEVRVPEHEGAPDHIEVGLGDADHAQTALGQLAMQKLEKHVGIVLSARRARRRRKRLLGGEDRRRAEDAPEHASGETQLPWSDGPKGTTTIGAAAIQRRCAVTAETRSARSIPRT